MGRRIIAGVLSFLVFSSTWVCIAQGDARSIYGRVTDPNGDPVFNASIMITPRSTSHSVVATTRKDGRYSIGSLSQGDYTLELTHEGFASHTVQISLGREKRKKLSIVLSPVASGQGRPTGTTSSAQTSAGSTQGLADSNAVSDLPSNGRDLTEVATLQAGVNSVKTQPDASNTDSGRGQRGFGAQISVSGGRPQQNNYILNGISINDYANSAPGSVLGLDLGADAVEQFTVSTSSYPADYGRSSGGIINAVTRSGGPAFHGSVYEFLRNSTLDSKNYFDGAKPPFRRNQFGGAVGGPLYRKRLFLFANFEALRQSLGVTHVDIVPSQTARNGNLSTGTVQVDPQATRYLAFYPLPNRGLIGNGDTGNFAFAGQQITPETYATTRIDYKIRSSDALTGSYVFDGAQTTQPDQFNLRINEITTQRNLFSLQETHSFAHHLVNSARLGVNRVVAEIGLTPTALQPIAADTSYGFLPGKTSGSINISGLTNFTGGLGGASPYHFHWTSIQGYDDLSYTVGRSSLRLGVGVERMRDNMISTANPNGNFNFNSLSDYLTNRPFSLGIAIPGTTSPRDLRQILFAAYFQDDVRLRPNLTVNFGLRYEMATVPTETTGRLSALRGIADSIPHLGNPYFENPTRSNFEPRLGAAWDVLGDQRLMVRSGFGIFDVLPLPYEFELLSMGVAPFFENATPNHLPPFSFPGGAVQLAQNPTTLRYAYIEPHPRRNYVTQWNLNLEIQPSKSSSLLLGYVGSRGIHQPFRADDSNLVLPTRTSLGYAWPTPIGSGTKINPGAGRVDALIWRGDSYYSALQVQGRAVVANSLNLQLSYTWGKSIDTGSATIAGDQFANSVSSLPWYDLRLNRGLSDFNVGQNLSIHFAYQLPSPRKDSHAWYLKQWKLIGTYQASSGSPFTPVIAGDPLGTGSADPFDVPNRVVSQGCSKPVNAHQPLGYIKLQCFAFPNPVNVFGNVSRNSVLGPGLMSLDSALFKESHIHRISSAFLIQTRVEVFNILNHPNFAAPLDHRTVFDASGNPVNGAGQIDTTTTPSRQMQLGLKIIW
jgi:Carboxypeptidase regulatory-like domain/TonB-dependent Receptor Plug Domain